MTLQYKSCGIGNVWLLSGYKTHETKYGISYSYEDIDGLYRAISIALCADGWAMTSEILRFLRKRLGLSQGEFGGEFGCTSQAVAKWEKGTTNIPVAVDRLVRFLCLEKFAPQMSLHEAITRRPHSTSERLELEYINSEWCVVGVHKAKSVEAEDKYHKFDFSSQNGGLYLELMGRLSLENKSQPYVFDKPLIDSNVSYENTFGGI